MKLNWVFEHSFAFAVGLLSILNCANASASTGSSDLQVSEILVYSLSGHLLETISNGDEIDIRSLPAKGVRIRARATGARVMLVKSTPNHTHRSLPASEIRWIPQVGRLKLTAITYSKSKATAIPLSSRSVTLRVVRKRSGAITPTPTQAPIVETPAPTPAATIAPTGTPTSAPSSTPTSQPSSTSTPSATRTSTPVWTATSTPIGTSTPTRTPTPTPTRTSTPTPTRTPTSTATQTPTAVSGTPTPTRTPSATPTQGSLAQSALSAVWANDGGNKVTRDELRGTNTGMAGVANRTWSGSQINLFGAKNEVVAFNLVLEAATAQVDRVSVQFDQLNGPGGAVIRSVPATGDGVFSYLNRNIELFYVRYLQIKGLSRSFYEHYDERHIPSRFRRPWSGQGVGSGTWANRPDHDKYYPDITVPLEAVNEFSIGQGKNQSIWADVYIPSNATAGVYTGVVTVLEGGSATRQIPVSLTVRNFALPDQPTAKTMLYIDSNDINKRYLGATWPATSADNTKSTLIRDRHYQMAHRHKISLIDDNFVYSGSPGDAPPSDWLPRLNGSLFDAAHGYDGPGVGVGNNVYSIGTYGNWSWKDQGQTAMNTHTDGWVNWFDANSPATEYFLYLIDESPDYAQFNGWASQIKLNPGPGQRLKSFTTASFPSTATLAPNVDIVASWMTTGITSSWQSALDGFYSQGGKQAWLYNSNRPASGSFGIEDDGVALRELVWGQVKKGIKRWFSWDATYYNNYQGGLGETDVFSNAHTFGGAVSVDPVLGETGWNYNNGDGVLMYPGTEKVFPAQSYGLTGPIASVRMKEWRRGIQDADYIALAKQINPTATQAIITRMVPKALWEYGVNDVNDPTWVLTDISWSTNPDDWEQARADLAHIIDGN